MSLSLPQIEGIAPDQASLKAAAKLMKPGKWPLRSRDANSQLIWGECQGSGSNPYRVMADVTDLGYKCTCPSRKFPCKHSLALMWMYAEGAGDFSEGTVPDWVTEWMGRRRNTGTATATGGDDNPKTAAATKSIAAATAAEPAKPVDPKAEAKKKAAAEKRAIVTRESVQLATLDLEQWIADQLRGGQATFQSAAPERCRRIAARLVDAKAQVLAGRVDELPSRIAGLGTEERLDALITELGKLVLLVRAWRQNPDDPALHRSVIAPETREQILDSDALSVSSRWEVAGERISTRKDGLVSQATWLHNLQDGEQRFALLLDFFPAHLGKRSSSFTAGEQFDATLKFYPGRQPLRALIAERAASEPGDTHWLKHDKTAITQIHQHLDAEPWALLIPVTLPAGRICQSDSGHWWWQSIDEHTALPLTGALDPVSRGINLEATIGLWNGSRLDPVTAQSNLGRLHFA